MSIHYPAFLKQKIFQAIVHGNKNKEKKQILSALDSISTAFLNKYEFKYGFVKPSILTRLLTDVEKRVLSNDILINEVKEGKMSCFILAYLFICERCQSFLSPNQLQNEVAGFDIETTVDVLRFSLEGLFNEKFLDYTSYKELMKKAELI